MPKSLSFEPYDGFSVAHESFLVTLVLSLTYAVIYLPTSANEFHFLCLNFLLLKLSELN